MRKLKLIPLLLILAVIIPSVLPSCAGGGTGIKIGVLREDDTSGEASAWEDYLREIGRELGFSVDFTTTNSSSSEVAAINTYASKGYDAIMLFSDDDIPASVNAASSKKMYVVCPTGHPTAAQYDKIKNNAYFLGSVAPDDDTEYKAGYDMAKYFVETLSQTDFTVFGGATGYGSRMHVERLAGMLTYMCEDASTSYDGMKTREAIAGAVIGTNLDPAKFRSDKYRITGYMSGFEFDDAFSTKLTASLEAGGTCILSVGAGDTVAKIAYGIISSNNKIPSFMCGGVDAITEGYASSFDLGYAYDCGKYASAMAPGVIMILSALNGKRITNEDGTAPRIAMSYWTAASKEELTGMLKSDNKKDGYCYNGAVINHYVNGTLAELTELCSADYDGAVAIKQKYGMTGGETTGE